jgi:glucose dehydrogenase
MTAVRTCAPIALTRLGVDITRQNVAQLRPSWTYPMGDDNVYQFNPINVDTTMYMAALGYSFRG